MDVPSVALEPTHVSIQSQRGFNTKCSRLTVWLKCTVFYFGIYTIQCVFHFTVTLISLTDLCPFGNIYTFEVTVSIGPLAHRFECNSVIRLHGAKEVNVTFITFEIETNKDVMWFYPGLTSDPDDSTTYPGYDNADHPDTFKTYTEPNFWLEVYTDKNIISEGFTLSISAGKSISFTIKDGLK